jgi:NTE family protein
MFNPLKYFRNRKVGLALGSGGSKGIAHISVIEYLLSRQIPIDFIAGSSIGAVIGVIYSIGKLDKFKKDILKANRRQLIKIFDPVFPKNGLLEGKGFYEFLKNYIPEETSIEDLKIPVNILATDFNTGNSVVFRKGNILEALRASMAIPGIFVPVKYKSTFLLDGGVANPLPINVAKMMGAGITIAVNLHPRVEKKRWKSFVKSRVKKSSFLIDSSDIEIIEESDNKIFIPIKKGTNSYFKFVEKWLGTNDDEPYKMKTPNIFETISQAIDIMEYMNTRLMLKYNSPSVLIEPEDLEISSLDFTEIPVLLKEGYEACYRSRRAISRNVKFWV